MGILIRCPRMFGHVTRLMVAISRPQEPEEPKVIQIKLQTNSSVTGVNVLSLGEMTKDTNAAFLNLI